MPVDVDAVAAAASACPSVTKLSSGTFTEVATYLPGRRVTGVKASDRELEVHVVAAWDVPLPDVADEVRSVVAPLSEGRPVAIYIDDIDVPPSLLGAQEPAPEEFAPGEVVAAESATPPGPGAVPGEVVSAADPDLEEVTLSRADVAGAPAGPAIPADAPRPEDEAIAGLPSEPAVEPGLIVEEAVVAPEDVGRSAHPSGRRTPDDAVLEQEVPGDVIPGEPAPTPPEEEAPVRKRSRGSGKSTKRRK